MKTKTVKTTENYSCLKATEGGISQKDALAYFKEVGMPARRAHSPYVGHYGIEATGTPEQHEAASKYLFG